MGEAWIIDTVRTPPGRDKKEGALKGPAGMALVGKAGICSEVDTGDFTSPLRSLS